MPPVFVVYPRPELREVNPRNTTLQLRAVRAVFCFGATVLFVFLTFFTLGCCHQDTGTGTSRFIHKKEMLSDSLSNKPIFELSR